MVSTGVDKSNSQASEPIVYSRIQDSSYRYPWGACICTHIYVYVLQMFVWVAGVRRVRGLHVRGVRVVCMCAVHVCGVLVGLQKLIRFWVDFIVIRGD